ncbi:TPA: hypothetical protein ACX6SG_003413 [Photobacterium damselae]
MSELKVVLQPTKKIMLWGYLSNVVLLISSIGLLPVILTKFSTNELALYFIIQTILTLVSLMDLGYGPQLSKQITYILSGAQSIEDYGLSKDIVTENINYKLLSQTLSTTKVFYRYIALTSFFMIVILGYLYLNTANSVDIDEINNFGFLWLLFGVNVYFHIRFAYIIPLLNGAGLIVECRKIIIYSKISFFIICVIFLLCGFGVLSVIIGNILSLIIVYMYGRIHLYKNSIKSKKKDLNKEIFLKLFKNSNRIGAYYLSSILLYRGSMLVGAHYLSDSNFSSFGLLVQLMAVINTFAALFNTLFQTKISQFRTKNKNDDAAKIFSIGLISYTILASVGVLLLSTIAPYILFKIGSETTLPAFQLIVLYGVISIFDMCNQMFISFIATKNIYPFVRSYIISSSFSLLVLWLFFNVFSPSVIYIIIVPFSIQLLYNYWKWPIYVCKELDINICRLFKVGFIGLK